MRQISSTRFVRILAKHREWGALAKYALRMAEIDQLHRANPGEQVKRALIEAEAALADKQRSPP
jgi:hypothetical protein